MRILKKFIAVSLVAILVVLSFPPMSVSAVPGNWNFQRRPVTGLIVEPSREAGGFSFRIGFYQPAPGLPCPSNVSWNLNVDPNPIIDRSPPRPDNLTTGVTGQPLATMYDVGIRNATLFGGEIWDPGEPHESILRDSPIPLARIFRNVGAPPNPAGWSVVELDPMNLPSGSLYEIWVQPYWENPTRVQQTIDGVTSAEEVWNPAPMHTPHPGAHPETTIFFSGIQVTDVETTPNQLTVTWENPVWTGGRPGSTQYDFFDEWVIAWRVSIPGPFNLANNLAPSSTGQDFGHRIIPASEIGSPFPATPGRPMFQYTISDIPLSPGQILDLRVEPRRGGRWVRPSGIPAIPDNPAVVWGYDAVHEVDGRNYRFISVGNRNGDIDNEYRYDLPIMVQPRLTGQPFGPDRILLTWDPLAALVTRFPTGSIRLVIYEYFGPTTDYPSRPVLTLPDLRQTPNASQHFVPWEGITETRWFMLRVYINGFVIESNMEPVPWHGIDLYPWRPEIRAAMGLPPIGPSDAVITGLRFLAFYRPAFNEEEQLWINTLPAMFDELSPGDFNYFVAQDVMYHVIVTDNRAQLEALSNNRAHLAALYEAGVFSAPSVRADALMDPSWPWMDDVVGGSREPNFTWNADITTFFPGGDTDNPLPLEGNRIYYVMIFATWDGSPSRGSVRPVFMPPFDELEVEPVMLPSPPIRIEWPIENNEVTVVWDVRFLEIEETDFTWPNDDDDRWDNIPDQPRWHGAAMIDSEGVPRYGSDALRRDPTGENSILNEVIREEPILGRDMLMEIPTRNDSAAINAFTDAMIPYIAAHMDRDAADVTLRATFLDGYRYDFLLVTLNEIIQETGIDPDDPVNSLLLDGPNGLFMRFMRGIPESRWQSQSERFVPPWSGPPAPPPAGFDGSLNLTFEGSVGTVPIMPNTRYILFVRTVHPTNDNLTSLLPSYILFTTPDGLPQMPVQPTVPILREYPDFVTSTSIGVYWRIIGNAPPNANGIRIPVDMHYELRWSENIFDHPDSYQMQITWAQIVAALENVLDPSEVFDRDGNTYIRLLIPNMFPQTLYHVWIRALPPPPPPGITAPPPSGWSNPVSIWTLPLEPPPPPGLNRVPQPIFNLVSVTPLPTDLFALLTRIQDDNTTPRIDDFTGIGTSADCEVVSLPQATHSNMYLIRFANQPPNTVFYVRARTIMSVSRVAEGGASVSYSYEVQISLTDAFLDVVTIIVPELGDYDLRIMSSWVQIRIPTGDDPGAWPGLEDPAQFPMPDRDFEITYDPFTQTLKFRFRTNRVGADGLPDQNADYRFIGRLTSERINLYTIDLTSYAGLPISNRIIEVPVSIMNAFEDRSVVLVIVTGQLDLRVPPGAFNTQQVRNLSMATRDYFQIMMNYNPRHMPTLDVNTSFATIPAHLNVVASANGRRTDINAFNRAVGVSLPTDGVQNVGLFRSGEGFVGWQDTRGEFSWGDMSINASTYTPMTFAGIARNAPPIAGPGAAVQPPAVTQAMQRVMGRLNFTDLITFDRSRVVTVREFNNVVNALAHGRQSVTLGAQMSQADVTALTRARFYTPAAGFNRAVATEVLVRLYELRTGQILTPTTPLGSVPGLANAPAALQHNLRKAADIGFITGPFFPNEQLTMGELMIMLDIIITDSGF